MVGARCAGAPLAMLLARAGHKVALVDRASFPSDTMSTHFLWQRGAARLQAWGLLGRLRERGCAPIRQITFDAGPVQLTGIGPAVDGVAETYCPRRTVLDALLVEAAAQAGADLVDGFVVSDLLWSDGGGSLERKSCLCLAIALDEARTVPTARKLLAEISQDDIRTRAGEILGELIAEAT